MGFLEVDNWDDFGFKTLFYLTVFDEEGKSHEIGSVKIGFIGQTGGYTKDKLNSSFEVLPDSFFSLGQDVEYYKKIASLSADTASGLLIALKDVTYNSKIFETVDEEEVFNTSLLRDTHKISIKDQYARILHGDAPLTEYNFSYKKEKSSSYSGIDVEFKVVPNSIPPSNIHIVIGRNGVGKTTLLNNMVECIISDSTSDNLGHFSVKDGWIDDTDIKECFAGVVSISFSAFDPFKPAINNTKNNESKIRYHYVGLRKVNESSGYAIKSPDDLCYELFTSLKKCFSLREKITRWVKAVKKLETDLNFKDMDLISSVKIFNSDSTSNKTNFKKHIINKYGLMSSGHAIVLLSITKLIETVEEKTLILLDEPESHLHPPLLSAFIRALSDLLINRNAVAILATHSPVVLQEVPKSCVSILDRKRLTLKVYRPENETFAENVGILTREIFGLEVVKSGFHNLLTGSVNSGESYEEIIKEYNNQLGFEGKAILRSLIANRDK